MTANLGQNDFHWVRFTVIPFLIWVWSWLKYWLIGGFVVGCFAWVIKTAVREGVEEALQKKVVPLLDDIRDEVTKEQDYE